MKSRLNFRTLVWTFFAAVALLSLTVGAGAVQGDKKIRLLDDCDQVTFNEAFGEGQCVGNGHTTVDEFFEEIEATQDVHKWKNQPLSVKVNTGRRTEIENRGGEFHTFTKVAAFGGGFLDDLNELSGNPVPAPECLNFDTMIFLAPGGRLIATAGGSFVPLGTSRFQCCIHPWMRTTIEVRGQGNNSAAEASHHAH